MFGDDSIDLRVAALGLVILVIIMAVAIELRRRQAKRRRRLHRELDRMSARIAAVEVAVRQLLLAKIGPAYAADAPSLSVHEAPPNDTPAQPAVEAISYQRRRVRQTRTRHLEHQRTALIIVCSMLLLLALAGVAAWHAEPVSITTGVGSAPK
jgi:hypothetical protein